MDRSRREQKLYIATLQFESADERSAFVERECGADHELRRSLENLLDRQKYLGTFLENPAATNCETLEIEQPGTTIDPYKLLEQIGEGGMGVVYMAEQTEPVRRKVALKIIKAGMDTQQVIARFEAERQALAMMDHPNIARIFDGGSTEGRVSSRPEPSRKGGIPSAQEHSTEDPHPASGHPLPSDGRGAGGEGSGGGDRNVAVPVASGRPYFVMELVRGVAITKPALKSETQHFEK